MTDRYAVIGNPIAHSKSPLIHAAFARQTGQDIVYDRILGSLTDFAADVRRFFAEGGRGLNVTVPFKEQAYSLVDERSEAAAVAGALNTLIRLPDGQLRGDNTDGIGLVRDLCQNHGFTFRDQRILLVGAGGAARGVLKPLLETGLAHLTVVNRTPSKSLELARLGAAYGPIEGMGFDGLAGRRFDLIINATSAGLAGELPPLPEDCLAPGGWVYDMVYGDQVTPFCRWGRLQGAERSLDGLGMLVEQAAESFWLWRGVRPDTAPVIAELRTQCKP
ncbi:shikimate dehydrogenase [Caldichromatium japonicum]|uniref:Shikimate dehydrogenase (NADP(+)) n=1 Tax=Caldichromatium japonicum TaxID=2699430 RepID=A0A6G7VEP1_9GAMM|nr:shikimate dehydrogenase [Caldichromatium japonicum]QIK38355.1 shikimate dehydrogenase [Caldichromatium japonicum]